jgi:site-specific DNA-methyltransferase (adenine-specific)
LKPYYQDGAVTIYHGDCRKILPEIDPFDLLITDPPYGVKKAKWDVFPTGFLKTAWEKTTGGALIFWSNFDLERIPLEIGEKQKNTIVWFKPNLPALWMFDRSRLATCWEPIFYFAKKGFEPKERVTDHFAFNYPSNGINRMHPTEKPIKLIQKLIQVFDGQYILDPFMGSGTTLRAAKDLGRKAIGIEIEEGYCEMAAKRMSQEVLF